MKWSEVIPEKSMHSNCKTKLRKSAKAELKSVHRRIKLQLFAIFSCSLQFFLPFPAIRIWQIKPFFFTFSDCQDFWNDPHCQSCPWWHCWPRGTEEGQSFNQLKMEWLPKCTLRKFHLGHKHENFGKHGRCSCAQTHVPDNRGSCERYDYLTNKMREVFGPAWQQVNYDLVILFIELTWSKWFGHMGLT